MSDDKAEVDMAGQAVLEGLGPSRRPWQVMLAWTGADPPGPGLGEALGRILDLFPDVGSLTVHTAGGGIVATRDFHGNYPAEVDGILARLFRDDPGVVGVTFPATATRPAHTATPDDPGGRLWSGRLEAATVEVAQDDIADPAGGGGDCQDEGEVSDGFDHDAGLPAGFGTLGPSLAGIGPGVL